MKSGPQNQSVRELGLVQAEPLAADILANNAAYCGNTETKTFAGTTLGFVTPWNEGGYQVASQFAKKFNIISPVWLQIIKTKDDGYELEDRRDIDTVWLNRLRLNSPTLQIMPRILFHKFTDKDYKKMLSLENERLKASAVIVNLCLKFNLNGVVLAQFWENWHNKMADDYKVLFLKDLAEALNKHNLLLILTIPPHRETKNFFTAAHFDQLYKFVFAFALMSYDYSNEQRPGANAPLEWLRNVVEHVVPTNCEDFQIKRPKLLLGLNMYGYDFAPGIAGTIVAGQYLNLLRNVNYRLKLDSSSVENYFEINSATGTHLVYYPTLHSINARIELARELRVGLSIWELGQGLNYFYDLF